MEYGVYALTIFFPNIHLASFVIFLNFIARDIRKRLDMDCSLVW